MFLKKYLKKLTKLLSIFETLLKIKHDFVNIYLIKFW